MIKIEFAKLEDAKEILKLYDYYIQNTAITFEVETPSLEEFENRIKNIQKRYPYLVARKDEKIVGHAYANVFKDRAAYDWAVEVTIYVDPQYKKQGIGKQLYSVLESILKKQGIINLYACIASPVKEDQYLNYNSIEFHSHLGYVTVGTFHKCGYKFDTWYDMVWMEKMIGKHTIPSKPIKSMDELIKIWGKDALICDKMET
ncbi:MAG: N-acetyltransferase [Faecalicoccus sp.]|nr:N-acetyltransferase [Faecalicoccus sp.]